MNVDGLVRRAVHLGVLLGGADQRGDAAGSVLDLAQQRLGLDCVGQPPDGTIEVADLQRVRDALEILDADTAGDQRRRDLPPGSDAVVVEPVGQLILAVAGLQRGCTRVTAIAPSPTAEATRFTDSARASPATKTPGRLDSR